MRSIIELLTRYVIAPWVLLDRALLDGLFQRVVAITGCDPYGLARFALTGSAFAALMCLALQFRTGRAGPMEWSSALLAVLTNAWVYQALPETMPPRHNEKRMLFIPLRCLWLQVTLLGLLFGLVRSDIEGVTNIAELGLFLCALYFISCQVPPPSWRSLPSGV